LRFVWGRKRVDHFEEHGFDPGTLKSQKQKQLQTTGQQEKFN